MAIISKKICMLGDFGVGKTSLIRRFVERQFSDEYLSTVGMKLSSKTVELNDNNTQQKKELKLMIWDLEGETKFKPVSASYLKGASGIFLVADLTRQETIEHLSRHIQLYLSINPKGVIVIGLNKVDLVDEEVMPEILKKAKFEEQQVRGLYQTSAKTGENVDEIFETLAAKIIAENETSKFTQ
ncbi:MAG: GTP-binding protein [Moorea sp. SIO2B7]|nr:GTP-binding protein [Moorena sp. SIO2B7]